MTREELANNVAFLQMDLTDEELGKPTVQQSRDIRRNITALLEKARGGGGLIDVDTTELADMVYTVYNGE